MAQDTYTEVWNKVLLRCPSLSPKLAQDFVVNAFRRLMEIRRWAWLVEFGQFINPPAYSGGGTVSVTQNSTTVTGSGTTFTSSLVGQQFRIGQNTPIYTIASFTSATQIDLDSVWGGLTQSGAQPTIYQCFFPVPSDFHQFITFWDPAFNWQLFLDVQQSEINIWDAQRANLGNAFVVSFRDYTTSQVGVVEPVIQSLGTGNSPTSGGTYTAPNDAIFTLEITTGGIAGVARYRWKKNNGSYTSNVLTNGAGTAQTLQDGVTVTFPLIVSYTLGDIWVIDCTAIPNPGVPRYELWPHQTTNHVYGFLYEKRYPDLNDANTVIPNFIRGDVLMEMALEEVALWPGPSTDKPNPYYSLQAASYHQNNLRNARGNGMIDVLEVQDDNVWEQNLSYLYPALSWAMATPLGDSRWLQSHAI